MNFGFLYLINHCKKNMTGILFSITAFDESLKCM